jgi:integrase
MRIRRTAVMHAKRRLQHVPLQELTRDQLKDFFAWLLREGKLPQGKNGKPGPMKPRTVGSVYASLRAAFTPAAEDKKMRVNVAVGAFRYSSDVGGEGPQAWSLEEMQAFLASVTDLRDGDLYALALATGMRRGELLGLRWRDVDLKHCRVHVRRQWTMAGERGWVMAPLKTGTMALRSIEIDRFTVGILERQRVLVDRERAAWGSAYYPHGLVFPTEDGRAQDGSEVTKRFKRAVARCPDIPVIVFHGLRHTHATLLLEDGVSLKVVAQRLGDREQTVLRTYNHVLPRGMAIAAARVAAWLDPNSNPGFSREQSVSEAPERATASPVGNHDSN